MRPSKISQKRHAIIRFLIVPVFAMVVTACAGWTANSQPTSDSFRVEDSIKMPRLVDLCSSFMCEETFGRFSDSGEYFVTMTRTGSYETNEIIYTASVYATQTASIGELRPTFSFDFSSDDNHPAISSLRWTHHGQLSFIAPASSGIRQVHLASVENQSVTAITNNPTDVVDYALSEDTLVFFARAPESDVGSQVASTAIPVENRFLASVIEPSSKAIRDIWPLLNLYVQDLNSSNTREIGDSLVSLRLGTTKIWLSPSSKHAMVLYPPEISQPSWQAYNTSVPGKETGFEFGVGDRTAPVLPVVRQYMLLDIASGVLSPLIEAPSGIGASFPSQPNVVYWNESDNSVIVSDTYLPIAGSIGEDRENRSRSIAIAEIDLNTRTIQPIWTQRIRTDRQRMEGMPAIAVTNIQYDEKNIVLSISYSDLNSASTVTQHYKKRKMRWQKIEESDLTAERSVQLDHGLEVTKIENAETPPRLYLQKHEGSERTLIYSPYAQYLHSLSPQHMELHWTDENGIEWTGSILLPPNYNAETTYPLIIQTHGYDEDEFLVDGPSKTSSAFAAQALVNQGFVVLQMADVGPAVTSDQNEGPAYVAAYRSAIQALSRRVNIDEGRVGAIGWSRTGFHVLYAAANDASLFDAVIISDSATYGYMEYLSIIGFDDQTIDRWRRMNGATRPNGDSLSDWIAHAPTFNLNSVEAAVRVETYGLVSLLGSWEIFAQLRDQKMATDLMHFPNAPHQLVKPLERLNSQKSTVQWFLFWLMDKEQIDPVYPGQYELWREMRENRSNVEAYD